jgi:hypothetical protein
VGAFSIEAFSTIAVVAKKLNGVGVVLSLYPSNKILTTISNYLPVRGTVVTNVVKRKKEFIVFSAARASATIDGHGFRAHPVVRLPYSD